MEARTAFAWMLVALLAVITWLLIRPVLSWLLATLILAFVLFPVHRRLERRIGPRASAGLLTLLIVAIVVGGFVLGVNAVLNRGIVLLEAVSASGVLQRIDRLLTRYTGLSIPVQSLVDRGSEQLSTYLSERTSSFLSAGFHALIGFLLLAFVLYYLLKDGRQFVRWLKGVTPLASDVQDELFASAHDMTWAVLKGHVLVAIVQGTVAGVSLFITGVPQALLLTVAMMFLAIVPIIGVAPVLGGAVVYLLVNGQTLSAAFVVVWGLTSVAISDDYLRALFIERGSEMHSAVVLVGIVGGTYLLGPMGLFVGPILIGLFKTAVEVLGAYYGVTDGLDG